MSAPKRKVALKVSEPMIRTVAFQAVSFFEEAQKRQVVILYALGDDGVLREFVGGKWHRYAVSEET